MNNQAIVLQHYGRLQRAMALLKDVEQMLRQTTFNSDSLQACIGNQGFILEKLGDLKGAMEKFQEHERICRSMGSPPYPMAISMVNQSFVARQQKDFATAVRLADQAYRLAVKHGLDRIAEEIRAHLEIARGLAQADSPKFNTSPTSMGHQAADPERATRLNLEHIAKMRSWNALPWWKRLVAKKPERPRGI